MQPNPNMAIAQLFPLIFLFIVFYFLLIRPQKKKQAEHKTLIENLKKNDEVVTSGGVHGTIVNVKEKTFVLRIDDTAKMEIDKSSVSYISKKQNND
jgi:preprotein translocase subunit YajC